ncbi:MAG: pilus assembly protein PilM, partial [Phycisphaerales bacterium]
MRSVEAACGAADDIARRMTALLPEMRRAGFTGREVVLGLPRSVARMQVVRMAAVAGNDASDAVSWEASERLGIPHDSIVASSLVTGAQAQSGDTREERIVVGIDRREVAAVLETLLGAGYEPSLVEPRFASIARALSRRTRRDADVANVRAVLHIEDDGSTVLVLRGEQIAFCRELALGGRDLDAAVAARLGVSAEQAAMLRSRRLAASAGQGPAVDAVAEDSAHVATRATLDMLAGEVARAQACVDDRGVRAHSCGRCVGGTARRTDQLEPRLFGDGLVRGLRACDLRRTPRGFHRGACRMKVQTLDLLPAEVRTRIQRGRLTRRLMFAAIGVTTVMLATVGAADWVHRHSARVLREARETAAGAVAIEAEIRQLELQRKVANDLLEQQRSLGAHCPSLYDLRNLFQVNVEEGRHLWAMVYLLHSYFGRDGREEA